MVLEFGQIARGVGVRLVPFLLEMAKNDTGTLLLLYTMAKGEAADVGLHKGAKTSLER